MWQVLAELDFLPLLWSACPWHTHVPGRPLSNRTPTLAEAALGTPFWQALIELFPIETVVAVGNVAHRSLQRSGLDVPKIRHPAHGGRAGFKRGLQELLRPGSGRARRPRNRNGLVEQLQLVRGVQVFAAGQVTAVHQVDQLRVGPAGKAGHRRRPLLIPRRRHAKLRRAAADGRA